MSDERPSTVKIIQLREHYARKMFEDVAGAAPSDHLFEYFRDTIKQMLLEHEAIILAPYNEAIRRREENKRFFHRREKGGK
jgi:hypothetical protein